MRLVFLLMSLVFVAACNDQTTVAAGTQRSDQVLASADQFLNVYKSPSCGCCEDWIEHMKQRGFVVNAQNQNDLSALKHDHGVTPELASCHTAVTSNGLIIEGHVPAKLVQQFIENTPEGAMGLTIPGMPMSAPGMDMGGDFIPYEVLVFFRDGRTEVYATITDREQQL